MDPGQLIEAQMVAGLVDELDYYQVLKVDEHATRNQIKQAYYRESRAWHPDLFYGVDDEAAKQAVNTIAKRITEAYTVLRDPETRAAYDRGLKTDRKRFLRFSEDAVKAEQQAKVEEIGSNPKARELFRLAQLDVKTQQWESAEKKLKMALSFEPGNGNYRSLLAEAQKNIKTDYTIK